MSNQINLSRILSGITELLSFPSYISSSYQRSNIVDLQIIDLYYDKRLHFKMSIAGIVKVIPDFSDFYFSKHCHSCIENIMSAVYKVQLFAFWGGVVFFIYLFVIYGILINRRCPVTGTLKCVFNTLN